uniref:G-protein coupled receptors family 1 profile domain-containing protein n=1 Tax=Panagrolaimus davidi TaxID=227884 RepID=A0A914PRL4_9BILA
MALDYDPCLKPYMSEPSFMFISHEIAHNGFLLGFILISLLLLGTFSLGIFFICLIRKHKGGNIAKQQRYLIISALVQLSITIFFNIVPVVLFIFILCFEIPHTENFLLILFSVISTHSFLESLATLYFVTPYRKAIISMYHQIFLIHSLPTVPIHLLGVSRSSVMNINIT